MRRPELGPTLCLVALHVVGLALLAQGSAAREAVARIERDATAAGHERGVRRETRVPAGGAGDPGLPLQAPPDVRQQRSLGDLSERAASDAARR